ncbi:uncharacterized protein LOC133823561 [Humulus lupulus]|uniref:uncharacterized protein LOC133823561 n=1 Tax=Humulus lupulus TaxID=3486 RepID=UPI002B4110D6|nr:uncharacterized protein LOC133823561 [Humulus lupulus]XP_062112382.1 uncharacterized protein LOC133823561 [Humulus lupulus]
MDKRRNITQYRERLDRTLASPKLTDAKSLKSLVKTQILQSSLKETEGCSETVVEKRTAEVSNFLDMLRSVSDVGTEGSKTHDTASSHPDWKLKQDNEEFRVMYREGPQGSPFHSLLVEGYVNGPLDVCLCISWESALYRKWWPQSTIPTFKILSCNCLQKVRIGEQISLVRVKVSWPLSTREAIVHYFLFEYLEDDLLVVILNTVSDIGSIDASTHGFTNETIPNAKDVVRIDVVGGFAIQKVTSERSYFRTIASMDIKLDFVPPSLINFISRQLIGNGFRLYQKAVASMFTGDDEFNKALKDSLYTRIQETLGSTNKLNRSLKEENTVEVVVVEEELKSEEADLSEEQTTSNLDYSKVIDQNSNCNHQTVELPVQVTDSTASCEIVELKSEESKHFDNEIIVEQITERSPVYRKGNIIISSDVEQALGTLEKVISMVREYGFNTKTPSWFTSERSPKENDPDEDSKFEGEDAGVCSNVEVTVEFGKEASERTSSEESVGNVPAIQNSRQGGSNSFSKEGNHNRIAPASPEHKNSVPFDDTCTNQAVLSSAKTEPPVIPIMNHNTATQNNKHPSSDTNDIYKSSPNKLKKPKKQKSSRLCCIG